MSSYSPKVSAVILAFSRFEMLQQLISALRSQTYPLNEIIVIDQGNDQAMSDWLDQQADLVVYHQENRGSAGGFCAGIRTSVCRGHDWTWIFDDDALPRNDALEKLARSPYFSRNQEVAFLASRVTDRNGKTYMSPDAADANKWYGTVLEDKCVEVTGACWLGLLVSSSAVKKYGLPVTEFFLGEEDIEFTQRLAREARAYCAIESIVVHYQHPVFDPFGKDFYRYAYIARNQIGRAKLLPGSWLKRHLRAIRTSGRLISSVLKGQAPFGSIPWILAGLFWFRPKIRLWDGE